MLIASPLYKYTSSLVMLVIAAHSHLSHRADRFSPSSGRGLDFSLFLFLSPHLIHWKAIRSMALSHPIALLLQLCL